MGEGVTPRPATTGSSEALHRIGCIAFRSAPRSPQPFPNRPSEDRRALRAGRKPGCDRARALVGEHMAKTLGQPVVVESRAGAERRALGSEVVAEVRARWLHARHRHRRDHRGRARCSSRTRPYQLSNFAAVRPNGPSHPLVLEVCPCREPARDFRSLPRVREGQPGQGSPSATRAAGRPTTSRSCSSRTRSRWTGSPFPCKGSGPALIDLMRRPDRFDDRPGLQLALVQIQAANRASARSRGRLAARASPGVFPTCPRCRSRSVADFEAVSAPAVLFVPAGTAAGRDPCAGCRAQQGARGSRRAQEARRAGLRKCA